MKRVLRHLPLLMLTALLLVGVVSCGDDEPGNRRHDHHGDTPTPVDTTHTNDTTHHTDTTGNDTTHNQSGNDTTTAMAITVNAPRDYGYMGQTLQLTAVTTKPATVSWRSTRTMVATVDNNGLVTFGNSQADTSTTIIATAGNVSDSLTLANRHWAVAVWSGTTWAQASYFSAHPGDTISLTIVDSQGRLINDNGFNAAAVKWTTTCYDSDVNTLINAIDTPSQANGWRIRWRITDEATRGANIIIMAECGDAASAITCTILR